MLLQLDPTLLVEIFNFLILLFFLRWALWKPLMQTLENRRNSIESKIKEAEGINEEAKDLKARYEEQIAKAKDEAQKILKEAASHGERLKEQILAEAKEEVSRIRKQAEQDIESEKERAVAQVKSYLVDLTIQSTRKILENSLDKGTQEKLVVEFMRKIPEIHVN
jgi:F-type H+-transporting ATPase subunit b